MANTYAGSINVDTSSGNQSVSVRALSEELNGLEDQLQKVRQAMDTAFAAQQVQALAKGTAAAAKAQNQLASAVRKAGQSARRSLADFDELNRLASAAASSSSSSSRSGKKSTKSTAEKSAEMQETPTESALDGLKDFFSVLRENLEPSAVLWQNTWAQMKQTAAEVWPQIRQAAQDCWDSALSPLLLNLRDVFLPGVINSFSAAFAPLVSGAGVTAIQAFGEGFVWSCGILSEAVNSVVIPALNLLLTVWQGMMEGISSAWTTYGEPLAQGILLALTNFEEILTLVWQNTLQPFFRFCIESVGTLWEQHLKPLWNNLTMLFSEIGLCVLNFWNGVLAPLAAWLAENFGPVFELVFEAIAGAVIGTVGVLSDLMNTAVELFRGVTEFLNAVFRHDWDAAWSAVQSTVTGVWEGITSAVKGAVNTVIGFVNGMISAVVTGVNTVIGALNRLSFTIPDWVPGIGGNQFGFNIGTVTAPQIPYLAQGAVIPPNREFLAVLGDQTSGTNVEAPLATIQQAVAEVMQDIQDGQMAGFETIAAVLREILSAIYGIELTDEQIGRAAYRWQSRQAVVSGGAL